MLLERQRREIQGVKANNQRAKFVRSSLRMRKVPYLLFRAAETRTLDMTSLWNPQLNEDCSYFVFVTFVEIYNNYIYDLFDDDILNK